MPKKAWGDATMFVSPVTGDKITSPNTLALEHWASNVMYPVLFSQAFDNMCFREGSLNVDTVVEIGAHSTLAGPIRQVLKARNVELPNVSCLKRPVDAVETMHDLACALIGRGYPANLKAVNSPFEVEVSWLEIHLSPIFRHILGIIRRVFGLGLGSAKTKATRNSHLTSCLVCP
jgi:acyl transferase domain-containing protein